LRSPTRRKNSTFSKYPPPRLFASSSDASSGSAGARTCAFQSSADISSVVSFFPPPLREPADGGSASCSFGLRRPGGRLVGSSRVCADAAEVDAAGASSAVGDVGMPEPPSRGAASSALSGGFQRGHFLASAESSGTSTISLSLHSQRSIRKAVENRNAHTTSSPANRCRFSTLTIRLGSLSGGVDGAFTESWNLAHNACRSLQLLRHFSHRKTYHTSWLQLDLPRWVESFQREDVWRHAPRSRQNLEVRVGNPPTNGRQYWSHLVLRLRGRSLDHLQSQTREELGHHRG
jgi:hypothetical protein